MTATFRVDLHVHLGAEGCRPVKIGASPALTLEAVVDNRNTGMDILGIVDCQVEGVSSRLLDLVRSGCLRELPGGGFQGHQVVVIAGAEIQCRGVHYLCYVPDSRALAELSNLYQSVANPRVSTGALDMEPALLAEYVRSMGGTLIPAHAFTPYRGLYGKGLTLQNTFGHIAPDFLELGLSADSDMACRISELRDVGFVTSSDAHSIPRIGREHTLIEASVGDYTSVMAALSGTRGKVLAHYGLDPRLGKYHRTICRDCGWRAASEDPSGNNCPACGSRRIVRGVWETARGLSGDSPGKTCPPYIYNVPLDFLPGVGPVALDRALRLFGDQWSVIHDVDISKIEAALGPGVAQAITRFRCQKASIDPGGGGRYGRLMF